MSYMLKIPQLLVNKFKMPRKAMGNIAQPPDNSDTMWKIRKTVFNMSKFNRYGLYSHDVINEDFPIIQEALRRLPVDVLNARNFRIMRTLHLDLLKIYLPKEKWITFEQDLNYRYLQLYLTEIMNEWQEIQDFGCTNYDEEDWPAGEVK